MDIKVLGDNQKKSRFNPNLADEVNTDVENRLKKEARINLKNQKLDVDESVDTSEGYNVGNRFIIDMVTKSSDAFFSSLEGMSVMAAIPTFYQTFQQISRDLSLGDPYQKEKASIWLNNFQTSMHSGLILVTDTKIKYGSFRDLDSSSDSTIKSKIIHYDHNGYGLRRESVGDIYYRVSPHNSLDNILGSKLSVDYINYVLGTVVAVEKILSVLAYMHDGNASNIKIENLEYSQRHKPSERNTVIFKNKSGFHINTCFENPKGICYGVRYLPPKVNK